MLPGTSNPNNLAYKYKCCFAASAFQLAAKGKLFYFNYLTPFGVNLRLP